MTQVGPGPGIVEMVNEIMAKGEVITIHANESTVGQVFGEIQRSKSVHYFMGNKYKDALIIIERNPAFKNNYIAFRGEGGRLVGEFEIASGGFF